ncbi:MAG: InlB B-repeat-containing protein [Bacillota bacterium]|nr:InlB B-repeat-containing protein [Bacillota bacterium]
MSGKKLENFAPRTYLYDVWLKDETIPVVTAVASDPNATIEVIDAVSLPGVASVVVTAMNGVTQKTYIVNLMEEFPVTVSFNSNGGSAIEPIQMISGQSFGILPVPNLPDSIFLGWYTDNNSFNNAVSDETVITSDVILNARYATMTDITEIDRDAFISAMDCASDFELVVESSDHTMSADAVKEALQLEVLDHTDFAGISVSGSNGEYIVTAVNGYTPGSSYKLTLQNDALSFSGQSIGVRTYCFTILSTAIINLKLNAGVISIPADSISTIIMNGTQVSSLSIPLDSVGLEVGDVEVLGTFTYDGTETLAVGDILAIYEGIAPEQRIDPTVDYSKQDVAYIEIIDLVGLTVSYKNAESQDVLFIPDVLPVSTTEDMDGDPNNLSMTFALSRMDFTGSLLAEMGLDANTVVEAGDYLAIYAETSGDEPPEINYGCITSVIKNNNNYIITYTLATEEDLNAAMRIFSSYDSSYEQMIEGVDLATVEAEIELQAIESGFANAAAHYLSTLAQQTEGFTEQLENVSELDVNESKPEISNLVVEAQISGDLLHFSGLEGLRCAVTVSFDVDFGDNMSISLSGTFVEEIRVSVKASGGAVWKWYWYGPRIVDYRMTANLDVYNFTGIDINATLTTSDSPEGIDIEAQIREMMNTTEYQSEEISAETKAFYELYSDMLQSEHDYVEIFKKKILSQKGFVDPYHILAFRLTIEFAVSVDVNLSLGSHFAYEKATRYIFTLRLFAKSVTSDQLDLVDENYELQFYVMGTIGLRAGIIITAEIGIFSVDLASIGIQAETGPYVRLWGYFFYDLKYANKQTISEALGSMYLEMGVYLKVNFLAQALDNKYFYNPTLYENEWPLWSAGIRYNVYDFAYDLTDATDDIMFKGDNITYTLPTSVFRMNQLDLKEGDVTVDDCSRTSFIITSTNSVFSEQDGVITVDKPMNQVSAEGYVTIYWIGAPLSFTTVPIYRTYHVTWDNLAGSYTICFDSQGGSLVSDISGAYQSAIILPVPHREGYSFNGWYQNSDCTGNAFTTVTMPAANIQLYAKWTADADTRYTVKHLQQTVAGSSYELVAVDTQIFSGTTDTSVTPDVNVYEGFTSPVRQTVKINADGGTIVEYYYKRNSYQLSFILDPENEITSTKVFGVNIFAPWVTKTGYDFIGWYIDEGLNDIYTLTTMPAQDLKLFASWFPTDVTTIYQVEYYQENLAGTDTLYESIILTDVENVTFETLTKTYVGFTHDTTLNEMITEQPSPRTTKVRMKLYYKRNSYTLTFDANGGIDGTSETIKFGMAIIAPIVSREDFFFNGWNTEVANTMPAENLIYVAHWIKGEMSIRQQLSSGDNGVETAIAWVNDTITLTWDESLGSAQGIIKVSFKKPSGGIYSVGEHVIPADASSPYVFTTTDQGLGNSYMPELGLYQFQAEYIPDIDSVFSWAVSPYEDAPVTVIEGIESTETEILESLGIAFHIPEDALNVSYLIVDSSNENYPIAQVTFTRSGIVYKHRIQPTLIFKDISGTDYMWTIFKNVSVSYCSGELRYNDGQKGLCLWYDSVPGLMYSLFMSEGASEELLSSLANELFVPVQE